MSNTIVVPDATPTHFRAEDVNDPTFYIDGNLSNGVLHFQVVAVYRGKRDTNTGREFFDKMMEHFGDSVTVISATWTDSPDLRTNLDIFNAETGLGRTKQDAAFATKTGTWAKEYQYTTITLLDTTPLDFPGGYEQVLVDFMKPST